MTDMTAPVAVQATSEPTNKLVAGTNAAAGVGAVIAGVLAAYGGEAIKEVWPALVPTALEGPAFTNLVVMGLVGVATFYATRASGRAAAYNVMDKPNIPIATAPSPRP